MALDVPVEPCRIKADRIRSRTAGARVHECWTCHGCWQDVILINALSNGLFPTFNQLGWQAAHSRCGGHAEKHYQFLAVLKRLPSNPSTAVICQIEWQYRTILSTSFGAQRGVCAIRRRTVYIIKRAACGVFAISDSFCIALVITILIYNS